MLETSSHDINLQHLLSIEQLDHKSINLILNHADTIQTLIEAKRDLSKHLASKISLHLFFEPSTRTQFSFEIAAKKLGLTTLTPSISNLSCLKGESLSDTINTFAAMGTNLFIIRHPDPLIFSLLTQHLPQHTQIINAGNGSYQHPTQALIDLYTIRQFKPNWSELTVSILGDVSHSRVANSLIQALKALSVKETRIIAPELFMPEDTDELKHIKRFTTVKTGLENADVIFCLRIQKERIRQSDLPNIQDYTRNFMLTNENILYAKPDSIVLHPGPINRGVEISSSVADGPQSKILTQISNSIAVRMAILDLLINR